MIISLIFIPLGHLEGCRLLWAVSKYHPTFQYMPMALPPRKEKIPDFRFFFFFEYRNSDFLPQIVLKFRQFQFLSRIYGNVFMIAKLWSFAIFMENL